MSMFNIKQTVIAAVIATGALAGVAQAESFNERGEYFPGTVQTRTAGAAPVVQADIGGYNERDEYFVSSVTVSDSTAKSMVKAEMEGFNQRGEYFASTVSGKTRGGS